MSRRGSGRYMGRVIGLHYQYDKEHDVLTVEGQQFSGDFFRQFALVGEKGVTVTMQRMKNGVITFTKESA